MDFQGILLVIAGIFNLGWLIFFLTSYFRGGNKKISNFFVLVVSSVLLWIITMFFYRFNYDNQLILIWCRWLYVAAALIPMSFLYFAYLFPDGNKPFSYPKIILIVTPPIVLIFLTLFSNTIIYNAYSNSGQENIIVFGYLYILYTFYISLYFLWSFWILAKKYKSHVGIVRYQIIYILLGVLISSVVGMVSNLLLPWLGYFKINWLGQVATIIWVSLTIYPIIRYRLSDIRVIIRKFLIYFLSTVFVYGVFYFIAWVYVNLFGSVFASDGYLMGLLIAPVFVYLFYIINRWLSEIANKYLFFTLYNYQETINKLSEELTHYNDLNKIIDTIVDTIKKTMGLNRAGVLLVNMQVKPTHFQIAKVIGFNEQNGISLVQDNFLTKYLEKTQKLLVADELNLLSQDAKTKEIKDGLLKMKGYMDHIEASLCMPLVSGKKLIGIIVLGSKVSGNAYSKEDLELLNVLAHQAGIAINNARLYKESQEFSKTLQSKVDDQTKDLKKTNKELKVKNQLNQELLIMKNDFLRVVNHQLNTPLSVMRSSFSMVDEGTFSPKKGFDYAKAGLERMSETIKDFWDAFELEGEKMKVNFDQVNIEEIASKLIEEKKKLQLAQERKIDISATKSTFKIPLVWCDGKKITHVISNLLDNAVFYTYKGKVTLSYELLVNQLKINVVDTGIGISEENKKRLFLKFSRGVGSTNLHPDGSGLGLYIAKKIVEANEGEMTYASEGEGKGSTFSFTVPLYTNQKPIPAINTNMRKTITMLDKNKLNPKPDAKN